MVGQLRLKPQIEDWEGDEDVTFYAANVHRPRELRNLVAASSLSGSSSSSGSSPNSSTSDLSSSEAGLQGSSRADEARDTRQSRLSSNPNYVDENKDVELHKFCVKVGRVCTNVPFSIVTLIVVSALSVLLGAIAIKVVKPAPEWDKSLDAFEIPNHPSTLHRDMFQLAQKDKSFPTRPRRSVEGHLTFNPLSADQGELEPGPAPTPGDSAEISDERINPYQAQGADIADDVFNQIPPSHFMNIHHDPMPNNNAKTLKSDNVQLKNSNNITVKNDIESAANNATSDDVNQFGSDDDKNERSHLIRKRSNQYFNRYQSWRLQLVYMAKGADENIFTPERLQTIHDTEMSIMRHRDFTRFCARNIHSRDDPSLAQFDHCLPPNSLMTYFFPSQVGDMVRYDSMGSELADINGTLSMAMKEQTFYWFVDTHMNSSSRRSKFIRTEFWFGKPVGDGSMAPSQEYSAYKKFIYSYIDLLDKASTDKVDVLYGGTELFDEEVSHTIHSDVLLSIPTFLAILLLLLVFTSFSPWLCFCGLLGIAFSFCCAFFCYRVFFGIKALGLLNVVSVFVIIGIGVDDVFVFVNTFRQADAIKDPAVRMGHTISTAGAATFFTSITTAGAFGANMASQIPAIFDFGLFMTLLVLFCWLMVIIIMPPALNIWHKYLNCELYAMQRCKNKRTSSPHHHPRSTSLYRVLAQYDETLGPSPGTQTTQGPGGGVATGGVGIGVVPPDRVLDDSDIPMLDLEEDPTEQGLLTDDEDDVPLLHVTSAPATSPSGDNKEAASLTAGLQKLLYRFVAKPVMAARWGVIVVFGIILCVTVVLVSRLEPASRPPALYRPDTNLQRLLDLAYNFSGKDISCRDCSGFQQGGAHPIPPVVPFVPSVLTPQPQLPTHSPETTLWPPVEPSVAGDTISGGGGGGATDTDIAFHGDGGGGGGGGAVVTAPMLTGQQTYPHGWEPPKIPVTPPPKKVTCKDYHVPCFYGSVCEESPDPHGTPTCACRTDCDQSKIDPVCGSDKQTYANVCQMRSYACMDKRYVTITKKGVCEGPPIPIPTSSGHNSGGDAHPEGPIVPVASPGKGYNPCGGDQQKCAGVASRPVLDNTAMVFLVFGVKGLNKSEVSTHHVLNEDKGTLIYDPDFLATRFRTVGALCKLCKAIGNNRALVREGGAECFHPSFWPTLRAMGGTATPAECSDLPRTKLIRGQRSHVKMHYRGREVAWFAMAFESNIYEGKSSFEAYKDYNAWEKALKEAKSSLTEEERIGLESAFQTCDYWEQVFMEIIGVTSAIYGVAFSLIVCVIAVAFFTAHIVILLVAFLTIAGVILVVVSLFYLLGWQMGAVEAVSLSILVGSSIDYCIHLIEGYRVAGTRVRMDSTKTASQIRQQRTIHSVSTIGVSILSSALTTIIAAVPLCFTTVQLFAKFGQIVALNTLVSIVYTLTACASFLGCVAPARYRWSLRGLAVTVIIVGLVLGAGVVALFILHQHGVTIPGPSGDTLFG